MLRLQYTEGIQLEGETRMTGPHDAMCRELSIVAQMATQTKIRAGAHVIRGIHAQREVVFMLGVGGVRRQPTFRTTVTALATDAVVDLKLIAALRLSNIVSVTVQTDGGGRGIGYAELLRDFAGTLAQQGLIRRGVFILLRPGDKFVLQHMGRFKTFHGTVANAGSATRDAEVFVVTVLGQ